MQAKKIPEVYNILGDIFGADAGLDLFGEKTDQQECFSVEQRSRRGVSVAEIKGRDEGFEFVSGVCRLIE